MNAAQALIQILNGIAETIREAGPMGAPAGHIYAALQAHGCTLQQYQQIEAALLESGQFTKQNDCLIAV